MKDRNVKESDEWQALNNIWKSCSAEQKETLRSDFETITLYFKKNSYRLSYQSESNNDAAVDVDYHYLSPLSEEARAFLIDIVGRGGKNLYHSFMAYLDAKDGMDKNEIIDSYYRKFAPKRPYLYENKALVLEIFSLCWDRYHQK